MKLKFKDTVLELPESKSGAARMIADLFLNSGRVQDEDAQISWEDMAAQLSPKANKNINDTVMSPDIRPLMTSSLDILIREPVEPLLIITSLFTRIQSKGLNTQVIAGAMGAVTAADVAEGQNYPEVMFNIGGAMQTAWIGKSGLQASFSDEALRYSTWDIMAMNLKLMGQALVRHTEQKAVAFLHSLGTTLFDNIAPTSSLFGVTTGRGLNGGANGSLIADDLMRAYAHMAEQGFPPDVLLCNPQMYFKFVQDPTMRAMFIAGSGGAWFNPWNGSAAALDPWSYGSNGMGPSRGQHLVPGGSASGEAASGISGREHGMTSAPSLPGYWGMSLRVVVSPFVPYDADTQLGDIFLLSSGNVGYHLIDEEVSTSEWRDENVERTILRVRQRDGFAVANEGQGVGVLRNIKNVRNYWDGTVQAVTHDIDSEISPTADIDL